jgi:hypothetical protein
VTVRLKGLTNGIGLAMSVKAPVIFHYQAVSTSGAYRFTAYELFLRARAVLHTHWLRCVRPVSYVYPACRLLESLQQALGHKLQVLGLEKENLELDRKLQIMCDRVKNLDFDMQQQRKEKQDTLARLEAVCTAVRCDAVQYGVVRHGTARYDTM